MSVPDLNERHGRTNSEKERRLAQFATLFEVRVGGVAREEHVHDGATRVGGKAKNEPTRETARSRNALETERENE